MSSVDEPRIAHFQPEPTDYTQRLVIGPKFLASLFKSNLSESEEREQHFSRKFLKWVKNEELPYKRLILNQHALDEAATHLKKKGSPDTAFSCVDTVLSSEIFNVRVTNRDEFKDACNTFCKFDDHDGAMTDFITKSVIENSDTSYLVTWDSHYQAFDQVKLLPRCDYD